MPEIVKTSVLAQSSEDRNWESHLLGRIGTVNIRHRTVYQKSSDLHEHADGDEVFYVLDGEMILEVEGRQYVLHPGDLAKVAPKESHRIIVEGKVTLLVLDDLQVSRP